MFRFLARVIIVCAALTPLCSSAHAQWGYRGFGGNGGWHSGGYGNAYAGYYAPRTYTSSYVGYWVNAPGLGSIAGGNFRSNGVPPVYVVPAVAPVMPSVPFAPFVGAVATIPYAVGYTAPMFPAIRARRMAPVAPMFMPGDYLSGGSGFWGGLSYYW